MPDQKTLVDRITGEFTAAAQEKKRLGLPDIWVEADRYWRADHWPEPTAKTKTYPRPVENYIFRYIEGKIAALVSEEPNIVFLPREAEPRENPGDDITALDAEAAQLFSDASSFTWEQCEMDTRLEEALRTAALMGTSILYSWWDEEKRGGNRALYKGDISVGEIDPSNFFPLDRYQPDIQKQPGIIVASLKPLDYVKLRYKVSDLKPENSSPETEIYDLAAFQDDLPRVLVLEKWWKEKGQLRYAVAAQGKLLRYDENLFKSFNLYPFAVMQWYPGRKSFWGVSEFQQLRHMQREFNRIMALTLRAAQNVAFPKVMRKRDFVPRVISNDPGEMVDDMSPPGVWGLQYLAPPNLPVYIRELPTQIKDRMREVSGMTQAFSGEPWTAELNAAAIIQLQNAAGVLIRPIRMRMLKCLSELAKIWEGFWKEYYTEDRLIRITGDDGKPRYKWFRGIDYADIPFDVEIVSGPSSLFNQTLLLSQLDKMLQAQIITPDEYLEMLPKSTFPYIQKIIEKRRARLAQEQQQGGEITGQEAVLQQLGLGGMENQEAYGGGLPPETGGGYSP